MLVKMSAVLLSDSAFTAVTAESALASLFSARRSVTLPSLHVHDREGGLAEPDIQDLHKL